MSDKAKGLSNDAEDFMERLGYIHDSRIEEITATSPRSRARWKDLQGVMFGNARFYAIDDIKALLQRKLEDKRGHDRHQKDYQGVL